MSLGSTYLRHRHATDVWKIYQGGITQAVKHYAKASEKYVKGQHILDETSTYLQYLDPNNLCGWVMVKNLSIHGLAWGKVNDFTPEKWQTKLINWALKIMMSSKDEGLPTYAQNRVD